MAVVIKQRKKQIGCEWTTKCTRCGSSWRDGWLSYAYELERMYKRVVTFTNGKQAVRCINCEWANTSAELAEVKACN